MGVSGCAVRPTQGHIQVGTITCHTYTARPDTQLHRWVSAVWCQELAGKRINAAMGHLNAHNAVAVARVAQCKL